MNLCVIHGNASRITIRILFILLCVIYTLIRSLVIKYLVQSALSLLSFRKTIFLCSIYVCRINHTFFFYISGSICKKEYSSSKWLCRAFVYWLHGLTIRTDCISRQFIHTLQFANFCWFCRNITNLLWLSLTYAICIPIFWRSRKLI